MPLALPQDFYFCTAQVLAKKLLGCVLVRHLGNLHIRARIVETEAYVGIQDAACHTYRNRKTARNATMYAAPGMAYVYFTYGMHHCMNVVAGTRANPHAPIAVLLRAAELLHEQASPHAALVASNRRKATAKLTDLCNGPGKLCQALAINRVHDGHDLCLQQTLWIEAGTKPEHIVVGPRIGISTTQTRWRDAPLRFGAMDASGKPHPCWSKPFASKSSKSSRTKAISKRAKR